MEQKFISLENEFGDLVIERIEKIDSIERIGEGVRIFWIEQEEGVDYKTSFVSIMNKLNL